MKLGLEGKTMIRDGPTSHPQDGRMSFCICGAFLSPSSGVILAWLNQRPFVFDVFQSMIL